MTHQIPQSGTAPEADLAPDAIFALRFSPDGAGLRVAVDDALEGLDALVLPAMPHFPPRVDDAGDLMAALNITALVRLFNLSGHPTLVVPLAPIGRRPCGLQFVGRKGDDERLVALAIELVRRSNRNPGKD